MSRTFQVKKMKFCQMITKVWENDFQSFLVDFIFENFWGSRSGYRATGYLETYFNVQLAPP